MRVVAKILLIVLSFASPATAQESLRKYADALGINIGVAFHDAYINGTGSSYATHNDIVKNEFNTLVCENTMKAASIASSKTSYNFTTPDKIVDFAVTNKMKIRGHTLIWYFQNAQWLVTGDRETLLANMKSHIQTMMTHYKGKVYQWDVVNEPFADDGKYRTANNPLYTVIGEDYIDSAFAYAYAADPGAKLYINEYTTTFPGPKADALFNKVKKMLDNGIPVHGVGFQCHESAFKDLAAAGVAEGFRFSLERFASLGIELAVTELDIESSDFVSQAANYATYLRVVLSVPQCRTFMMWGVSDKDSWRSSGTPLIYDRDFAAKPAYDSLLAVLKNARSATWAENRRTSAVAWRRGTLRYNQLSNTLTVSENPEGGAVRCTVFDLRGARTASFNLQSDAVFSLSSVRNASGARILRAGGETLRLGALRR